MAFWLRINQSKLQQLSNKWRRFYFQAPIASYIDQTRISVLEKPINGIDKKPPYFYSNIRFFAAPFQAKNNKKEEVNKDGTRLNGQIKADFVRLVTEEGHAVVSIHEALERARKLDLDLVEVQRTANPPVCKLMDFYQERYKQQVKEKDRAKSKSGEALKKGECKEIRFTEKIEAKDLKMKAESVIRLMERGYRVKCMAMGKGKEDEDENLGGLLSRLTDLIKDVSVVESGPRVERKQAYVIVRHVKFGPLKKAGGKPSKVVGDTKAEPPSSSGAERQKHSESENEVLSDEDDLPTSSPMQLQDKIFADKIAWSVSESVYDFDKLFNNNGGVPSNSASKGVRATQQTDPKPATNSTGSNTSEYPHPATSPGIENRYKRSEPGNQFPPARSMGHMGQTTRESVRLEPRFSYQQQQPPQNMNATSSVRDAKQVRNDASQFGNSRPGFNDMPKQQPSHSDVPGSPDPSFGIFSPPKANSSGQQGTQPRFSDQQQQSPQNMNATASVREAKQVGNDASPFGNPRPGSNDMPKQQPSHSDVPGSPAPSFGIFSTPKANSSGQQGIPTDVHGSNAGNRYASVRNHGMGGNGASQRFSGSRRPNGDRGGKDGFGLFSKD